MPRVTLTKLNRQPVGVGGHIGVLTSPIRSYDLTVEQLESLRDTLVQLETAGLINWETGEIPLGINDPADGVVYSQLSNLTGSLQTQITDVAAATRILHEPTITPSDAREQPGQGPTPLVHGAVIGLHYDTVTDQAYRLFKIPTNYVSNASFHVHWTKAVDTNQTGATVRWRLSYRIFDGNSQDINVAPTVLLLNDVYDDAGTTTRIVHRTSDVDAPGFIAGYYIGVLLEYEAAGTTLSGGPVCVSADLLMRCSINQGN